MSQQLNKLQTAVEQQKKELVNGQNQCSTLEDLKKRVSELENFNKGDELNYSNSSLTRATKLIKQS